MENKHTIFLPIFVIIALVASGAVVTSQMIEEPYHAIVASLCVFMLLFTTLTFGNSRLIAGFLLPYIQTDPSSGSLWIDTGDRLNEKPPNEISDETLIYVIESSFPLGIFLLISVSFSLLICYDIILDGQVGNQLYGLLLNGYGAIVLSIDARNPSLYANIADVENNLKKALMEFWGFAILGLGFLLQIVQFLI